MNHSAIFAQQFSRLVWLAIQESTRKPEELDSTARAAEAMLRSGSAALSVRDWRLAVNGELIPDALSGVPDLTFAARLVGHGVVQLSFDSFTERAELIAAARALAAEPEVGDRGKSISARLQPLGLEKVHVSVSGMLSPDVASAAVAEIEAARRRYATPSPPHDSRSGRLTPPESDRPATAVADHAMLSPAALTDATHSSGVFTVLDAAAKSGTLARVLEDLQRQAETAANQDDTRMVYEIMYAMVVREQSSRTSDMRTPYLVAMKRLARPVLVRALARHLSAHRELDDEILSIFARMGDEAADVLVVELAESQQRNERRALFDILAKLKSGHQALRHSLTDPRWYVVRNAAELLGQMQAEGAASELADLLTHADDRVRRAAAASLSQLAAQQGTTDPLIRALNDPSSSVRAAAATGLGLRRNAKALDALVARLDKEDKDEVLAALVEALGRNGSPTAIKKLIEAAEPAGLLSKRKSAAYRSAAATALRTIDSPIARAAIEKLRQDKDASVRSAAGG